MSEKWWEDLPDGSAILEGNDILRVWDGELWLDGIRVRMIVGDAVVIHAPVSHAEPPVGSIVVASGEPWLRSADGWAPVANGAFPVGWERLRLDATRVLRWGDR